MQAIPPKYAPADTHNRHTSRSVPIPSGAEVPHRIMKMPTLRLKGYFPAVIMAEGAPTCRLSGKAMRRRRSPKGDFWGCPAYPDCKGTRRSEQRR